MLMIWATVSTRSCFCWLLSFSIFGYKEWNQSNFSVDHLVMAMCRVISCVAEKGYLLWLVYSLDKTLLAFTLFHVILQGQTYLLFSIFLDFLLLHSNPLWWKEHLFYFLVLLVFIELVNFRFFGISGWGIDLDYCDVEQFALEMNWDHSVIYDIAPKYCILDSFVDYKGYSISSKGLLPLVVDITVI